MTAGSRRVERGRRGAEPQTKRAHGSPRTIAVALVALVLLAAIATAISVMAVDRSPRLGGVSIWIEGRDVTLSVGYSLPPGIRVRGSELELKSGDEVHPIELEGSMATVYMGVTDISQIMNKGEAEIEGWIKARLTLPPISVKQEVDERIDISQYLSMNGTLSASNVTLGFMNLGEVKVSLDFATGDPGIYLQARNTTATIRTAFGSTEGKVDVLDLGVDGSGKAVVRIPLLAIAPLFFGRNLITVDFWGFMFSFKYPLNE